MGGLAPATFIRARESTVWQLPKRPRHTSLPVLAASLKAPAGRSASPSVESYLGTRWGLPHTFMPRASKVCNRVCKAVECDRVSSSSFHILHVCSHLKDPVHPPDPKFPRTGRNTHGACSPSAP